MRNGEYFGRMTEHDMVIVGDYWVGYFAARLVRFEWCLEGVLVVSVGIGNVM